MPLKCGGVCTVVYGRLRVLSAHSVATEHGDKVRLTHALGGPLRRPEVVQGLRLDLSNPRLPPLLGAVLSTHTEAGVFPLAPGVAAEDGGRRGHSLAPIHAATQHQKPVPQLISPAPQLGGVRIAEHHRV